MDTFVFWQSLNSIHQSAFLNALASDLENKVSLIVSEDELAERVLMGWNTPVLTNVDLIRFDEKFDWKGFILSQDSDRSFHIFSGINTFKKNEIAFKYAIKNQCKVAVLTEPLDLRGIKGVLRFVRGFVHKFNYNKHLTFVLAIGTRGVNQFHKWGFSKSKIFEWAYTIESLEVEREVVFHNLYRIIYAGSILHLKGVDLLVRALLHLEIENYEVIFHSGSTIRSSYQKEIDQLVSKHPKIRILPFIPNEQLKQTISKFDLLVLPSRYDGWGAVVSEAIMVGTPVLVSKYCGAETLVRNNAIAGNVIGELTVNGLADQLRVLIENGKQSFRERQDLIAWAEQTISGRSMANYFKSIIRFVEIEGNEPKSPWTMTKK